MDLTPSNSDIKASVVVLQRIVTFFVKYGDTTTIKAVKNPEAWIYFDYTPPSGSEGKHGGN